MEILVIIELVTILPAVLVATVFVINDIGKKEPIDEDDEYISEYWKILSDLDGTI